MATMERTPNEECDRLLGKAINHSSGGRRGDAALCVEDALDAAPNLPYDAWSKIQAAKTVEGSEFRRYLESARDALEVSQ